MRRRKVGQILVDAALITEDQLTQALAKQEKQKETKGKRLGRIVVEKEWAREEDICQALSRQLNIPYVKLNEYKIPKARSICEMI